MYSGRGFKSKTTRYPRQKKGGTQCCLSNIETLLTTQSVLELSQSLKAILWSRQDLFAPSESSSLVDPLTSILG